MKKTLECAILRKGIEIALSDDTFADRFVGFYHKALSLGLVDIIAELEDKISGFDLSYDEWKGIIAKSAEINSCPSSLMVSKTDAEKADAGVVSICYKGMSKKATTFEELDEIPYSSAEYIQRMRNAAINFSHLNRVLIRCIAGSEVREQVIEDMRKSAKLCKDLLIVRAIGGIDEQSSDLLLKNAFFVAKTWEDYVDVLEANQTKKIEPIWNDTLMSLIACAAEADDLDLVCENVEKGSEIYFLAIKTACEKVTSVEYMYEVLGERSPNHPSSGR